MVDRTDLHTKHMRADAFLRLSETLIPTELINGVVIVSPSPEIRHQDVSSNTNDILKRLIPNGKVYYAPMDVRFDAQNVVQPDLFWVSEHGNCQRIEGKYFAGPPELIVEILSPSTARRDYETKFALYEQYGVREYWIIDLDSNSVAVWSLNGEEFREVGRFGEGDTFHSPLLTSEILINEIFTE
jgi:Uma2 family endonuclease